VAGGGGEALARMSTATIRASVITIDDMSGLLPFVTV
jgi:hypothetical protein